MQIKNAVSMIPYGLLSGIVDGQEVRITQLGENGFVFRMANQAEKIHEIWLQFFSQNGGCYKKLLIPADRMKKMEESRFFTEYTVLTEDKDYQKYVRQLLADYWKYISLKMTGEDGEVAAAYTDYPVHLDEDYAESLEEQKEEWFQEAAEKAKGQKLCENVELALELILLYFVAQTDGNICRKILEKMGLAGTSDCEETGGTCLYRQYVLSSFISRE